MTGIQLQTDFSQVKPSTPGGAQFPPTTDKMGWLVQIVDSTTKENKAKNGTLAVFKLEGLDGPVRGMIGEKTFNIANPSQQAVEIAFSEISAIAHVTGVLRVGNSIELHNKPFRILVRQQADAPQYTEVYGFLDVNGNEPGKAGQGPVVAQPAPAAPASGAPAWGAPANAAPAPAAPGWGAPGNSAAPAQQPANAAPAWNAPATGAPAWAAQR